ncbi:MAG TPA: hypothetical protein PLC53_01620 [Bacilli bacterium]|nr:hypothetical protein [Bacilli bacterium]
MRIGIDIDDTIAYTYEQVRDALLEEDYVINDEDIYYHDPIVLNYYSKKSDEVSLILNSKEDAVKIINKLKEEGYEIYFLTSRSNKYFKDAYNTTYKWLTNNGFKFDKLIINCSKKDSICEELKINYFIDDSKNHVNDVRKKNIKSYLFTSYFNMRFDDENRVNNWKEIYELITKDN